MALSRALLSDLLGLSGGDLDYPLYNRSGLSFPDDEQFVITPVMRIHYRDQPQRRQVGRNHPSTGMSQVVSDPDKFQVFLDVSHFAPNEIEVKTVDNAVVIHGKHEEKPDEHGFISREFTRRYVLPEGVEPETVVSSLNSQGILAIEAPRKRPEKVAGNERVIPIKVHHAPAVKEKQQEAEMETK